jgi:dipeptidyl aminopeptidase/acylaminoacyl peptidase
MQVVVVPAPEGSSMKSLLPAFLTLMAIGRIPDVFAASVNMNRIMNWLTMWDASGGGLREAQRFLVGDPVKDKAAYERMSSFTYFGAVKAPLLNLQGANDVRVPRTQAEEADRTIKKNGGIVETGIYPGEGHAFESIETQMDVRRRMVDWFDRDLKRAAAP